MRSPSTLRFHLETMKRWIWKTFIAKQERTTNYCGLEDGRQARGCSCKRSFFTNKTALSKTHTLRSISDFFWWRHKWLLFFIEKNLKVWSSGNAKWAAFTRMSLLNKTKETTHENLLAPVEQVDVEVVLLEAVPSESQPVEESQHG